MRWPLSKRDGTREADAAAAVEIAGQGDARRNERRPRRCAPRLRRAAGRCFGRFSAGSGGRRK
jgi:hypothetical protein